MKNQNDAYDYAKIALKDDFNQEVSTTYEEFNSWLLSSNLPSNADLEILHSSIIAEAKKRAENESKIDLDKIRKSDELIRKFSTEIPKGSLLHIHPSGTRSLQTVREILEHTNPIIDAAHFLELVNQRSWTELYPEEVQRLQEFPSALPFLELAQEDQSYYINLFALPKHPKSHSFERFDALFLIDDVFTKHEDPEVKSYVKLKTYTDFIKRAHELGVSYVEFTKGFLREFGEDVITFRTLKDEWFQKYNLKCNWNMAFVRARSVEDLNKNFETFATKLEALPLDLAELIRGIDFLAHEENTPAFEKGKDLYLSAQSYTSSNKRELFRTMHAGEHGDPLNPRNAVLLGAQRIGHGVRLRQDAVTLEYIRTESRTPIVANVSSNLLLGSHDSLETHPFLDYIRLGIPVTLSTDDEGMFHTDIAKEFELILKHTDICYSELKSIVRSSVRASFATVEEKRWLADDIEKRFSIFESNWVK